jgi:hypothetical protein
MPETSIFLDMGLVYQNKALFSTHFGDSILNLTLLTKYVSIKLEQVKAHQPGGSMNRKITILTTRNGYIATTAEGAAELVKPVTSGAGPVRNFSIGHGSNAHAALGEWVMKNAWSLGLEISHIDHRTSE